MSHRGRWQWQPEQPGSQDQPCQWNWSWQPGQGGQAGKPGQSRQVVKLTGQPGQWEFFNGIWQWNIGNDQFATKPISFDTQNKRGKWVWNSFGANVGDWTWTPNEPGLDKQSKVEDEIELEAFSWTETQIEFDQTLIPNGEYDLEIHIDQIKARFSKFSPFKSLFH